MGVSVADDLNDHLIAIEAHARAARTRLRDPDGGALADPIATARALLRLHDQLTGAIDGETVRMPGLRMLLDLLVAQDRRARVSVSSLCLASGVPPTTALRWIAKLIDEGYVERHESPADRRRAYIDLTPTANAKLRRILARFRYEP